MRYAKLINLQIALAASLKNKTVRKTVISKVAKFPRLDAATEIQRDAPAPFINLSVLSLSGNDHLKSIRDLDDLH